MRCNTSRNEGTFVRKIPSGIPKGQFGTFCSTCYLMGEPNSGPMVFLWFSYGFPMVMAPFIF
jgi:hypothetical protein